MSAVNSSSACPLAKSWVRKPCLIIGMVLLAGIAAAIVLFAVKWPFTREGMIKRLEKASSAHVEFGAFHSSYFPPGCVAESVVRGDKEQSKDGRNPEPVVSDLKGRVVLQNGTIFLTSA